LTLYYLGWNDCDDDYYQGNTIYDLGFYSSFFDREEAKKRYEVKRLNKDFPFNHAYYGEFVENEINLDKDLIR